MYEANDIYDVWTELEFKLVSVVYAIVWASVICNFVASMWMGTDRSEKVLLHITTPRGPQMLR